MGDENSLAGTTKAHTHSALSSDGGFLQTTVTGVTNLSEGSIVYGDASEIVTELSAGSEGEILEISSGIPAWTTASAGATVSIVEDKLTATFSSTGTTPTDITGWVITKPTITGGKCMSSAFCSYETTNSSNPVIYAMYDSTDGYIASCTDTSDNSGDYYTFAGISAVNDANGATIQMRGWSPAGTWEIVFKQYAGIKESQAVLVCMGVG